MRSGYWQDLTTADFVGSDTTDCIAVLPVAATEQHGPHLPLSTDAVINQGIVEALLSEAGDERSILVLPAINVGCSLEHENFPGTLSVQAGTLIDVWTGIGRDVCRAGIKKLVLLNSHGGQTAIVDLVAVKLRAECEMLVARANYFRFGVPDDLFDTDEISQGIHGGEVETSLMLHIAPQLVRHAFLQDFSTTSSVIDAHSQVLGIEKPIGIGWLAEDLNLHGVVGNAARADAVRGGQYLNYLVERLLLLCDELKACKAQPFDSSAR